MSETYLIWELSNCLFFNLTYFNSISLTLQQTQVIGHEDKLTNINLVLLVDGPEHKVPRRLV